MVSLAALVVISDDALAIHDAPDHGALDCYRTLWLRDQGLPHSVEAAICKGMVPEICVAAIQDCLVLHGHYGYTQDFPIEQRLRDVMGQIIADGTPQIQKLIIARGLFGREFV